MTITKTNLPTTIADIKEMYGTGREYIISSLDKCYACILDVQNDPVLQAEVEKIYVNSDFKKQKNTDHISMLTRLTIARDAKQSHPYTKVFRAAYKQKVGAADFLDWFGSRGGIERIRLSKTPISNKPTKAQTQAARKTGIQRVKNQTSLATVNFNNPVNFQNEVALLVVVNTGSSVELVEVLDSENSATKAYLTREGNK